MVQKAREEPKTEELSNYVFAPAARTLATDTHTPDAYGNTLLHHFALIQNDSALKAL